MTVNHAAIAALPSSGALNRVLLRNLLTARMPYVLADADIPTDLVAVDPDTGAAIIDIFYLGRLFHYDATDTTTANDGVTCLVSADGRRYKLATGTDVVTYAVLSASLSAPPASPAVGDAYLVAAGATGAWAGKSNYVAVRTVRGWEFVLFGIGRLLYVEDVDTYFRKNAAGVWTAGLGNSALGAGSVTLQNVLGAAASFVIKVENQTTNAPPTSPTAPTAYVVGPSPTGAWAGQSGKLAICLVAGSFAIISPLAGDTVYDKALQLPYTFNGTAWQPQFGGMIGAKIAGITPSGSFSGAGGSGNYSSGPVTTAYANEGDDNRTLTYAAKAAGNVLVFHYTFEAINGAITGNWLAALFRDSEVTAVDSRWMGVKNGSINEAVQMACTAADAASHVYKVRIVNGGGTGMAAKSSRMFRVEEFPA